MEPSWHKSQLFKAIGDLCFAALESIPRQKGEVALRVWQRALDGACPGAHLEVDGAERLIRLAPWRDAVPWYGLAADLDCYLSDHETHAHWTRQMEAESLASLQGDKDASARWHKAATARSWWKTQRVACGWPVTWDD